MKNAILYGLLVVLCTAGCGRVQQHSTEGTSSEQTNKLQVSSPQLVSGAGARPILSPTGDVMLMSGEAGLECIHPETGERIVLPGSEDIDGDVIFSANGQLIAYRTVIYKDHLRYYQLEVADLRTGEVREVGALSREREAFRFAGDQLEIAGQTAALSVPLVAVEEEDLVVYSGEERKVINPNGANTYLWASLSPDEQRIVYVAIYEQCHTYVCNMDGSRVTDLGYYIGAPVWYGNEWIIGQQDEDDAYQMTGSRLVAVRADGTDFQVLETPEQTMTVNPSVSQNGKMVYENEGKIYIINIQ